MKYRGTVTRGSIHVVAQLVALNTYREAFKTGRLGRAHRDVVREVYCLAADELHARSRWWFRLAVVWFVGGWAGSGVALLLGVELGTWWVDKLRTVALVLAAVAFGRYMAYDSSARLLTPPPLVEVRSEPEPMAEVSPDDDDRDDPGSDVSGGASGEGWQHCGHTWAGTRNTHDHVCESTVHHLRLMHKCTCGSWVSRKLVVEES